MWAYEQEHKKFAQQDVFVKWNLQKSYTGGKKQEVEQTTFIETGQSDETRQSTVYHRYYHMFKQGELETLIEKAFGDSFVILDNFFDHANWVVILRRQDNS